MKKFMKVIAFVTVMCMALSTVAFAETESPFGEVEDKTFTVTVTGAGNDQVALMIVEAANGDYNFSNPLYIDQMGAENGTAVFTAKIAADVDAVDVYVGYASNNSDKAAYLGKVELVEAVTEITVIKTKIAEVLKNEEAEADYGTAFAFEFAITAPNGVSAQKMVWAITYETDENGGTKTVYSDAVDVSGYSFGAVLGGSVTLGVAFSNGSSVRDFDYVEIEDVDAIFLFSNDAVASTADDDTEHQKFIDAKETNN